MKKTVSAFFVLTVTLLSFYGCIKSSPRQDNPPCVFDPCKYKAPAAEIAAVQAYLDSAQITGTTQHCSGLFYKIETPGTGKTPDVCTNSINAKYKGMLTNGQVFGSGQFQQPLSFDKLIIGWADGVPQIKEGGKITLYIPPTLGYGSQSVKDANGNVVIPANSITIFGIELITVY